MTTEEKAKAYDEALKQIKECTPDENGFVTIYPNEIFPELAENEDEKIRKRLIDYFKNRCADGIIEGCITRTQVVAWLEKQGEQKQVEVRPFNKVFSQEQIDEIDKRIETEMKLYKAKLMDAQMRAKDFPMTD